MTIDEMSMAIREKCTDFDDCNNCPCEVNERGWCHGSGASDEQIERNYKILFPEKVDHPQHYQGKHECIEEMIAMFGVEAVKHFCMCNVYKYRYRASAKNGQEDLDKANWYMDKLIELGGI